jgi:hypothetical protein
VTGISSDQNGRLGGPHTQFQCHGKEKNLSQQGMTPLFHGCHPKSLVTTLSVLNSNPIAHVSTIKKDKQQKNINFEKQRA